jgi:hypothetical protein
MILSEAGSSAPVIVNEGVVSRLRDSLNIIAKVALLYSGHGSTDQEILDVDDYIQTVLVGESLVANRGFDHRDLVRRYRTKPGHIIDGREVAPSGISARYKGQVKKLIDSRNLDFAATDGITSGSAMKVACIAAFYGTDLEALVADADRITRITHASSDARLAAQLCVLRYHQIFFARENSLGWLRAELIGAIARLEIPESQFFLDNFDAGAALVEAHRDPARLLAALNESIGLSHVATSVPLAACLWSFRPIDIRSVLTDWSLFNPHVIQTGGFEIAHRSWNYEPHRRHFLGLGYTADDSRMLGEDARSHFDLDTLFSIALSMEAAQRGLQGSVGESEIAEFTDNLAVLALNLVELGVR